MSEWELIESAPRDGTHILVWSYGDISIGAFSKEEWLAYADGSRAIEHEDWSGTDYKTLSPTHWQPLPTPPSP